jgi:hypothetical protein
VDAKWLTIPLSWYLEVRIFVPNFQIIIQSDGINKGRLTRKTGIQEEIRAASKNKKRTPPTMVLEFLYFSHA